MLSFCDRSEQNTEATFFYVLILKKIKFKNSGLKTFEFENSNNLTSSKYSVPFKWFSELWEFKL